ncbi:hypothetical protein JRQ81_001127 [Phrynocephalus forsythii]|uniref:DDE Tnp4 domain-containing protein n=1 Tax=Phrynocephalus forsythii TaxID=171643 RepID=A0A9Q0Y7Q6_9SAUR|nr:hypothetical protein JRQ81_001127 [Phrynocephalus forsythii]
MTRRTLFGVADKLRPYLMRRDTVMRSAVPVEERVAIGGVLLGQPFLLQNHRSGIPERKFHCCKCCDRGVPSDGTRPSQGRGHSGVNHDAHVFRSSTLYSKMEEGTLIPGRPLFTYAGVSIPPIILGDGAYPLCKWLMKPFAVPRNDRERHYNKIFNRSRCVVERAFGRLKAIFRRLSVRIEAHIENINSIIAAAVILHNICEREKHDIPDEEQQQRSQLDSLDGSDTFDCYRSGTARAEAEAVRNAIAEYLLTHVK